MEKVKFDLTGRRPTEKILLAQRSHPLTLGAFLVKSIIAIFALVALLGWTGGAAWVAWIFGIVFVISLYFGLSDWYCWNRSLAVVTTERVMGIVQKSLFHRLITEASLDKIQNVTIEVKGLHQTLLHYGDIIVQTAGANNEAQIRLTDQPNPRDVQQLILKSSRNYLESNSENHER